MLIFFGIISCFENSKNDPMCDALCDEQYVHSFSKPLDSYALKVSFRTADGEPDSIEIDFDGEPSSATSEQYEVSIRASRDSIQISSSYGQFIDNFVFVINNTELYPSFVDSANNEICGSVCTTSDYTLATDNIEEQSTEVTIIEELSNLFACATSTNIGDLFIIAHNGDYTQALIIHEIEGYDIPGGGYWENGFHNVNLSVELHTGTNVGANYCTDDFEEEEITEIFIPIDASELPEDISADEFIVFDYGPQFLDCEDCVPYAMLHVENFWFRSEQNNYAKVELINYIQSDILFNYGG